MILENPKNTSAERVSRERGREVEKQDVLTKLAELRENSNEADSAASLMIEAVRKTSEELACQ